MRNVSTTCYKGTVLATYDVDTNEPVSSVVILDSGEMCAAMRAPEFRSSDEYSEGAMFVVRMAIINGILPCTSGYLFSTMDPKHGSNKDMPKLGAELDVVEIEGKKVNLWKVPINRVLTGALK